MSSRDLLKLRPERTALVELGAAAVPPAQKDSFRAKVANYLTGIRYLSDGHRPRRRKRTPVALMGRGDRPRRLGLKTRVRPPYRDGGSIRSLTSHGR
jgi:hypothetical protein